jgi:hypothetical protein
MIAAKIWPKTTLAVPELEPRVVRLMLEVKESGVQVLQILRRQESVFGTKEFLIIVAGT